MALRVRRFIPRLAFAACIMLAACGQKGPLTLPDAVDSAGRPVEGAIATDEATRDENEANDG